MGSWIQATRLMAAGTIVVIIAGIIVVMIGIFVTIASNTQREYPSHVEQAG